MDEEFDDMADVMENTTALPVLVWTPNEDDERKDALIGRLYVPQADGMEPVYLLWWLYLDPQDESASEGYWMASIHLDGVEGPMLQKTKLASREEAFVAARRFLHALGLRFEEQEP